MPTLSPAKKAEAALRKFALGFPDTTEEFPWGDRVIKVRGKVFVFMGIDENGGFGMSVKLPSSGLVALNFPFASPTRYGLGKSGWITARFIRQARVPMPLLQDWVEESYHAVASKVKVRRTVAAPAATPRARRTKSKA